MAMVWMTHPDLPDQPIHVDEQLVASRRAAGWRTYSEINRAGEEPQPEVRDEKPLEPADLEFQPKQPASAPASLKPADFQHDPRKNKE